MSVQEIALLGSIVVNLGLFSLWYRLEPPAHFNDALQIAFHSDEMKGKPKKFISKVDRFFRLQSTVAYAARWSLTDIARNLFYSLGFAASVFIVTGCALQFVLPQLSDLTMWERVEVTGRVLFLGLLDALSFDLFSVFGIEARPSIPTMTGRAIIWMFYALEAILLVEAILILAANLWSAVVAILFPEPTLRLVNERFYNKAPGSHLRKIIGVMTTL